MKSELSTRLELKNGSRHPAVQIKWKQDDSWCGGGWYGTLSVWKSGDEKDPHEHQVTIGQGSPLGSVIVMFDPFSHGAWATASFPGVGVTERDLQWATAWAVQALKLRRRMGDLPEIIT
jgi:hypothetical protein